MKSKHLETLGLEGETNGLSGSLGFVDGAKHRNDDPSFVASNHWIAILDNGFQKILDLQSMVVRRGINLVKSFVILPLVFLQ